MYVCMLYWGNNIIMVICVQCFITLRPLSVYSDTYIGHYPGVQWYLYRTSSRGCWLHSHCVYIYQSEFTSKTTKRRTLKEVWIKKTKCSEWESIDVDALLMLKAATRWVNSSDQINNIKISYCVTFKGHHKRQIFNDIYPNTRSIIDCSEIYMECPLCKKQCH